jgi:hypothetical protein
VNGSRGCGFGVRWRRNLLFVQYAIFIFVCLNSFVMKVVSLPVYVNVAHDCAVGFFSGCGGICGVTFWGRIGKVLFCKMLCMTFSSCWYSAGFSW